MQVAQHYTGYALFYVTILCKNRVFKTVSYKLGNFPDRCIFTCGAASVQFILLMTVARGFFWVLFFMYPVWMEGEKVFHFENQRRATASPQVGKIEKSLVKDAEIRLVAVEEEFGICKEAFPGVPGCLAHWAYFEIFLFHNNLPEGALVIISSDVTTARIIKSTSLFISTLLTAYIEKRTFF